MGNMPMTMIDTPRPALATAGLVDASRGTATWHEVEKGFWVGNIPGRFLGTVEHGRTGYIARDDTGARVGRYSDAVEARAALSERGNEPRS